MKNRFEVRNDIVVIFINRSNGKPLETSIDSEDFMKVNEFKGSWTAIKSRYTNSFYVIGCYSEYGKQKTISLHRWITSPLKEQVVDHINHDTLDNRKANLRVTCHSINQLNRKRAQKNNNTSGVQGVYWNQKYMKWHARIQFEGKRKHLGYFDDLEVATQKVIQTRNQLIVSFTRTNAN